MKNLLKTEDYNSLSETDFTRVVYDELSDMVYIENPIPSIYEWVDLGLPSGTKWSTTNVGASVPEEYGLYFAWGEVNGYKLNDPNIKTFCKEYKYGEPDLFFSKTIYDKYNETDMLTQLELIDDAAYVSDNTSVIPTSAQCMELIENTVRTEEVLNNVEGKRFTSKTNGNSIFIPYYEHITCDENQKNEICIHGNECYGIWTNTFSHIEISFMFYLKNNSVDGNLRWCGAPIRPVKRQ